MTTTTGEPNPTVLKAIFDRVAAWAVETGRLGKCPKCKKGDLLPHPTNTRVCGCSECLSVFKVPGMEEIPTQAEAL